MSDIEDYYDDDYDGEWFWIEDANPDIADDLVATANYSPPPVDDPSLDLVESFSDWEYYSDDYYDDDPTTLRKHEGIQEGPLEKDAKAQTEWSLRKRKKRKLAPTNEIPELSLGDAETDLLSTQMDTSSFRGVMWKRPGDTERKAELYEPGYGEKVALLKNWREVFKISQPRNDGSRTTRVQNHSRASRTAARPSARGRAAGKDRGRKQSTSDIDLDDHSYAEDTNRTEVSGEVLDPATGALLTPPPSSISGSEQPAVVPKTKDRLQQRGSRLKAAVSAHDELPDANTVSSVLEPEASTRDLKPASTAQSQEFKPVSISVEAMSAHPGRRSQRKRRASISIEEDAGERTENTQPRSKQVVSTKVTGEDEMEKKAMASKAAVRRSTRTRNSQK